MPSWETHLEVAKRVAKKIKLSDEEKEDFLLANLLPDINCRYSIKDISTFVEHKYTHYNNFLDFYIKKKKYMENITVLGYLSHLITDYVWNSNFYGKKVKDFNLTDLNMEELKNLKYNDFAYFNNLHSENKINIKDLNAYLKNIKDLDRISLTKDDLVKTLNYINNNEYEIKEITLKFYTPEELEDLCNEAVNKVIDFKEKIIDQNKNTF